MVWRALCALGLPCRLVKGQDIANGALFRKPCPQGTPGKERGAAPLLLVPGGNARLKARALGEKGRQAVRDYLASQQLPLERLFLGAPRVGADDKEWTPRAQLSLSTN